MANEHANEHVAAAKAAEAIGAYTEAATRWNAAFLTPGLTQSEYQAFNLNYDRCKRLARERAAADG